jgi:hypothetical protein
VFERWRAQWRAGRASRVVRIGERQVLEFDTPAAGTIDFVVRFDAEEETLIVRMLEIYAHDVLEKGQYRADMGLSETRKFGAYLAGLARDLGYTRMRLVGQRTRGRRKSDQELDFEVAHWLRDDGRG